uniref:Uncharacterized protein n=2 Tax=Amphimedon queenslandica TaxID=400682 RepID=A0A1X7SWP4_AMPQE
MMERVSEFTAGINVEELHPKEKDDFVLSKDIISLHHIGGIISGTIALKQCRVKKIDCITPAVPVGKGPKPIHTTVTITNTDPGVYRIQCNPSTRGTHTIKVQVNGVHLEDTSLVIPLNPYLDNITPVIVPLEFLISKWTVSVCAIAIDSQGLVYVADYDNHCIQKFSPDGKFVGQFGTDGSGPGQLFWPI